MKSVSFTLNDFDFIVNPFHTACMDRKPTVVDNPTRIVLQSFGKSNHWLDLTFFSDGTPIIKKAPGTFQVFVLPEFLQIILQNINSRNGFIHLQQRSKLRFFILKQVFSILQKKVFASFDYLLTLLCRLYVFDVPNLVYDFPKGFDHMKLIKDNVSPWTALFYCLDIGIPHVHSNSLYRISLFLRKRIKEILQGFVFPPFTYPQDSANLPVDNDGKIMMSFLQRDFIYCKQSRIPYVLMRKFLDKMSFMNIFYRLPIKTQMLCHLRYRHVPTEFKNIGCKSSGNSLAGIHQPQILYHIATPLAFHCPVEHKENGLCIEDIEIPDWSLIVRVYFLYASLTVVAYRIISLIWLYAYCYNLLKGIYHLFHNLYSTKLKKCLNLYLRHRLSSSGFWLIANITYPEKITMSTIYISSSSTLLEKNLILLPIISISYSLHK